LHRQLAPGFGRAPSFWAGQDAGTMPLASMIGKACGPDKNFTSARATAPSLAAVPTPAA